MSFHKSHLKLSPEAQKDFIGILRYTGERWGHEQLLALDGIGVIASPEQPRRYKVDSVKHLILPNEDGLIVKYCLNLEPYAGPSFPVWDDVRLS